MGKKKEIPSLWGTKPTSVEHEILPANKQQITDKYSFFLAQFT